MKLNKPNFKKPDIKTPDVKMPDFVTELIADLRRRKLLPVAGVLLAAIVAVPVLMLSSSSEAPKPATDATDAAAQTLTTAPEAQTLVVAEGESLRDYRKRLSQLAAKDPFIQQFAAPEGDASGSAAATSAASSASAGSISSTVSSGAGSSGGSKGKGKSKKPSNGSSSPTATNDPQYVTYEIDAWTGESGDLKLREDVQKFTPLPFEQKPAAVFLGVTNDAKKALFQISSSVLTLSGDGICLLGVGRCDMISLAPGKSATMLFGPNGITYAIKVVRINKIVK